MEIEVVRLGHRMVRDYRVSTHVCLVARALGARRIWIEGHVDQTVQKSVGAIQTEWGGEFEIQFVLGMRKKVLEMKRSGFCIVHLTMYGTPLPDAENDLRQKEKIAILIGSQKVPAEYYRLADYNISVSQQPQSEIGALAITLDHLQEGRELAAGQRQVNAKKSVEATARGKKLRRSGVL